jgi:hypothetical protein
MCSTTVEAFAEDEDDLEVLRAAVAVAGADLHLNRDNQDFEGLHVDDDGWVEFDYQLRRTAHFFH